jgi:hypothetical protein
MQDGLELGLCTASAISCSDVPVVRDREVTPVCGHVDFVDFVDGDIHLSTARVEVANRRCRLLDGLVMATVRVHRSGIPLNTIVFMNTELNTRVIKVFELKYSGY